MADYTLQNKPGEFFNTFLQTKEAASGRSSSDVASSIWPFRVNPAVFNERAAYACTSSKELVDFIKCPENHLFSMTTKSRIFHKRQDLQSRMRENLIAIGVTFLIIVWVIIMKQ